MNGKNGKWLQIGATALASVTLVGALVYYNFIDKPPETVGRCIGEKSVDFTVETYKKENGQFAVGGDTFTLSSQYGQKVTIINFWATWCAPCKAEIPHFNEFYEEHSDTVEMLILTNDGDSAEQLAREYLNNAVGEKEYEGWTEFTCSFARFDENNAISNLFLIAVKDKKTGDVVKKVPTALPVTVVVDKDGIIRYIGEGALSYAELESLVLPFIE
ncbi:MAG: TlpA family protein disulfide reductase [Clostridia bacterium]|nr:TlpA family protein disulfide reductase [Clostridia bacterium]